MSPISAADSLQLICFLFLLKRPWSGWGWDACCVGLSHRSTGWVRLCCCWFSFRTVKCSISDQVVQIRLALHLLLQHNYQLPPSFFRLDGSVWTFVHGFELAGQPQSYWTAENCSRCFLSVTRNKQSCNILLLLICNFHIYVPPFNTCHAEKHSPQHFCCAHCQWLLFYCSLNCLLSHNILAPLLYDVSKTLYSVFTDDWTAVTCSVLLLISSSCNAILYN